MMELNGLVVSENIYDILVELRKNLKNDGIILLADIKDGPSNIMVSCPNHADGQERRPSCGISTHKRVVDGKTVPAGTVNCFTCNYRASFTSFISKCYGINDGGIRGSVWLAERYVITDADHRPALELNMVRSKATELSLEVSETELESYRYVHPYIKRRKVSDDVIELFDVGYDKLTDCITFPIKDQSGKVRHIQRRAVSGKQFINDTSARKSETLYGWYESVRYENLYSYNDGLYVTESIIDALTIWSVLRRPAVALMGAAASDTQITLLKLHPARKLILCLDADYAGANGSERLRRCLKDSKVLYRLELPDGVKDINELTVDQTLKLIPSII
jgi:hypothetical protein